MKIKIISLGCAKNEVDSEYLAARLQKGGHSLVSRIEQAEAVLVNTCGFVNSAKEEALDVIFQLFDLKKQGKIQQIFAAGCMIERYHDELTKELPEVDVFLPFSTYPGINEAIEGSKKRAKESSDKPGFITDFFPGVRQPMTKRPYAYLKISEGCNNHCSYCAIPLIRGRLRSRLENDILAEAQFLAGSRAKELILLGQDTTSYGEERNQEKQLASLLKKIIGLKLFPWIRLMYAHPAHLTAEVIDLLAEENSLLPYLDLPLQHVNNRILKKMNRGITKKQIVDLITNLRARIPGLVLRTTFIVGFPGETKAEFEELLDFIKQIRFERLGVFPFSREEKTPAYRFRSQVAKALKEERRDLLMLTQQEISAKIQQNLVGKNLKTLIESKCLALGEYLGRSYRDAPEVDGVVKVYGGKLPVGELVEVRITEASTYDLAGEAIA